MPEVPCREAEAGEVPRSAGSVRRVAERNGWAVLVTYARGTRVGADGDPLPGITDSIAVRCRRGLDWAVGVWLYVNGGKDPKWGYESGYAWRTGEQGSAPERLGFDGLKARLSLVS